jgi:hypothetical protein
VHARLFKLAEKEKKDLVCRATGTAPVWYPREITVHSPLRLGIDEMTSESFVSNIRKGAFQAECLRSYYLFITDEVPMLGLWIAHRVSVMLQSVADHRSTEFGRKKMLSVVDLFLFPPNVCEIVFSFPYKLII